MSKGQIAVIAGTLVLIVLLFLANTKLPQQTKVADVQNTEADFDVKAYIEGESITLLPEQKAIIKEFETQFDHATNIQKSALSDSLMKKWNDFQKPLIAAYYAEQKAVVNHDSKNWAEAGNRYFAATRFVKPDKRSGIFKLAINCFEKAVEMDPANVDTKINLAACYVEGTTDPMKGISMLKDIEKTDSNNINLQLNFAAFSEKSGQYEKAIHRYNRVLEIDAGYIEAYLHLADAYENEGNKSEAIRNLEKYIILVDDATIKTEVKNYINKLKTN